MKGKATKGAATRKRGVAHGDQVKAQAVAALLIGDSPSEIARVLDIPRTSVSNWKQALTPEQLVEVSHKKGERVDDLVYTYLVKSLETLLAQIAVAGNENYISKQPAGELASFFGVLSDKVFRILDAAERAKALRDGQGQLTDGN